MTKKVKISYPEVPAKLVSNFSDLITALNTTGSNLNTSSGNIQSFMGQTNGAVQEVVNISMGKATTALSDTWNATNTDGNHAHSNLSGVAGHLSKAHGSLDQYTQAIKDGMSAVETLQANNGEVDEDQADSVRQQISDLTNALSNIGLALDGAASLIDKLNNDMPLVCATGFVPGGTYPTFSDNSFKDSTVYMSENGPPKTPGGRPITGHAAQDSLARHGISLNEVDDTIDNYTRKTTQRDGATVYIKSQPGRGSKYSLVIVGKNGIVTAMKNLSKLELKNLGRNYGFNPNP